MSWLPILKLLILLTIANGTPVVAKKVFGDRFAWPIDGGLVLPDGRPLFGRSKTLRGIVAALGVTTVAAPLLGLDAEVGALVAVAAMAGDLLSSFLKRRLGLAPSSQAVGLDQIPESLFAFVACRSELALGYPDILVGTVAFLLGELLLSRLLYIIRVRDEPY
jgi:CDP-2,3-bis-(O-geranylgeranyl)-sn-glycerol synthase